MYHPRRWLRDGNMKQVHQLRPGQPDLTLDEVVCAMRKRKLPGSRTAVWRFFQRHKITFKKKA